MTLGLGAMGHGMAKNIALKMGESCKLYVYDINQAVLETFVSEYGQNGRVTAAGSPREIAEKCVCSFFLSFHPLKVPSLQAHCLRFPSHRTLS